MFRKIKESIQSKIFYTAWLCLHIAYQIFIEIRDYVRYSWKYVKNRLRSCIPLYSHERDLVNFVESVSKLSKIPKHLAISVIPDGGESVLSVLIRKLTGSAGSSQAKKNEDSLEIHNINDSDIDLAAIAKLVSWASAANISVISLYDYKGVLKRRFKELGCYVQEELVQDFWAVKQCREVEKPPIVKLHNVQKSNGYSNGVNGIKPHEAMHIFLYSRNDGKPVIVQAVKDIFTEKVKLTSLTPESNGNSNLVPTPLPKEEENVEKVIDERKLDSYLTRYYSWSNSKIDLKTDPDLLLVLGNINSTLGFLPWHIRLTEIHWLPSLKRLTLPDFQGSLFKYSSCQQRIGT